MLINLSLRFKTVFGSHTSHEHSKLGHKHRMLKGNSHPMPPVGPLQAHLALVLCIYRMLDKVERGHAPELTYIPIPSLKITVFTAQKRFK